MAEGLYRIGECIYMEVYPPPTPYQICKIEELRKNIKGSVEVAAKCFFRRKDLPPNLLVAADRHAMAIEEENEMDTTIPRANNFDKLTDLQKHQIKHRELFLSRQIETYKIDMVRGKCSVYLLNELEDICTYMEKEDTFFYTMVFDPNQKTLLVDKGEMRVGQDYQAVVPPYVPPAKDQNAETHISEKLWEPYRIPDQKVEQFLVVSRSIGTFARALLDGAKKPQISLRLGAAAASRDITLFHAMDTLHQSSYDISMATSKLVPRGPVLCADELEAWTQEDAKRFEDGLQDEKNFLYIQKRYLPWKPLKSIVAYYYMWKTTDRYQIQKRHRMIEKQNDLKEVIVHLRTPTGAPPTGPRDLSGKAASAGDMLVTMREPNAKVPTTADGEKGCESCFTVSSQRWVLWGPAHEHCRLCGHCYIYWRKYGGLKLPTRWETTDRSQLSQSTNSMSVTIEKKPLKDRQDKVLSKKAKDDLIPHLPFFMSPTGVHLYMRLNIGRSKLLKVARCPNKHRINTQSIPKPTGEDIKRVITQRSRGHKRHGDLASVQQALSSPPKPMRLPNSPMPISPSYKAKQAPKFKTTGLVSTSGTYVPPKAHPLVGQQRSTDVLTNSGEENVVRVGKREAAPDPDGSQGTQENSLCSVSGVPPAKVSKTGDSFPTELYFQSNERVRTARKDLGRQQILQLARSPVKKTNNKALAKCNDC